MRLQKSFPYICGSPNLRLFRFGSHVTVWLMPAILWPRAKKSPPASAKGTRWRGDFFDRAEFMLIEPPRECIFMISTWRVRVIEYRCDKVRFQYKYVLSTLLGIIRVDSITNYVLSTYLQLQIPGYEYRRDTLFHARLERAVTPGSHIAARGFERTIVIIAGPRQGACR